MHLHAAGEAPTDGLARLARSAAAIKIAASALRFFAACAVAFAGLLLVSLVLSSFERTSSPEPVEVSASAYLDFDLAVLRALADRGLAPASPAEAERNALGLWAHRPDWRLPRTAAAPRRNGWATTLPPGHPTSRPRTPHARPTSSTWTRRLPGIARRREWPSRTTSKTASNCT